VVGLNTDNYRPPQRVFQGIPKIFDLIFPMARHLIRNGLNHAASLSPRRSIFAAKRASASGIRSQRTTRVVTRRLRGVVTQALVTCHLQSHTDKKRHRQSLTVPLWRRRASRRPFANPAFKGVLRQRDFLIGPANGPDWPPNWSSGFLARNHANAGDCDAVLNGHSRSVLAQFGLTPKSKRGLAAGEAGAAVDPLDGV